MTMTEKVNALMQIKPKVNTRSQYPTTQKTIEESEQ